MVEESILTRTQQLKNCSHVVFYVICTIVPFILFSFPHSAASLYRFFFKITIRYVPVLPFWIQISGINGAQALYRMYFITDIMGFLWSKADWLFSICASFFFD